MAGFGHNSGRYAATGQGWRRFAWTQARRDLLPRLPVEVVRLRVKRAKALGLPYKTYAGVRASSGHDLVGFLFSSNALCVVRAGAEMPAAIAGKLSALDRCDRVGVTHLRQLNGPLDAVDRAPAPFAPWATIRDRIKAIAAERGAQADRFLVIGETAAEREWAEAGMTAGYLAAADYFADIHS